MTSEFVVFYDVLIDGELRTTCCHCVDERDLERELIRVKNHGFENVEVFKGFNPKPAHNPSCEV